MRRIVPALLLLLAAAPAVAQRDAAPRRPRLPVEADSNAAGSYYRLGEQLMQREPRQAADAFYWAAQLDPAWAEPLYARYVALLMSDTRRLVLYMEGDRRTRGRADVLRTDSLYLRALRMDPFVQRRFDRELIRLYVMSVMSDPSDGAMQRSLANFYTEGVMRDLPPMLRGRVMAGEGRAAQALQAYDEALRERRTRRAEPLRLVRQERGRTFALAGNDSMALVELGLAIQAGEQAEEDDGLIALYDSKAVLEHSRGILLERRGDRAAAREAYARALTEDLSYHPAHQRMGALALMEGDTATALAELRLAAETGRDEPAARLAYAALLATARQLPEAEAELLALTELAPYYADPWFVLGLVRGLRREGGDALGAYRGFLARARRDDPRRARVEGIATALSAAP